MCRRHNFEDLPVGVLQNSKYSLPTHYRMYENRILLLFNNGNNFHN